MSSATEAAPPVDHSPVPDYPGLLELTGRQYLVVGAGQGMGRQVCHALAQAGAARVLCADLDAARAARVAGEIGVGVPWTGDVTSPEGAGALLAATHTELDRIDGLVDIVGQASWSPIRTLTREIWSRDFALCLEHAYLLSQGVIEAMSTRGGSMVFISSVSGLYGAPNHAAYGAAKAALISWVQSLAVELGPLGIRANSVAPGTVLTPRMEQLWDEQRKRQAVADNAPLGRLGSTVDIAGAVLFLISDLSAFVSGRTLVVDGGVASKFPHLVGVPKSEG